MYDAPSTPGSDATTPASEFQPSARELREKGIGMGDGGFPAYDPTQFGSDMPSEMQDIPSFSGPNFEDKSELQKMAEAQAHMFDEHGNFCAGTAAFFEAETQKEKEIRQAERDAEYFQSFGQSSSHSTSQATSSQQPAQATSSDKSYQALPLGTQPNPHRGPAQSRRQPPGFIPDRPPPSVTHLNPAQGSSSSQQRGSSHPSGMTNGFGLDATSQQNGFAHPTGQQHFQAAQQTPFASTGASPTPTANGFKHPQRPQPPPAAAANGFAHTQHPAQHPAQQPAQQSYGSAGFPDTAMDGLQRQPSPGASGDFTSQLWATDARKPSQDWSWIQQQQQRKVAQRAAAAQNPAQQNFAQHPAQQNFAQQGYAQQPAAQQAAAHQPALQQQQQPLAFMQSLGSPMHYGPEPKQAFNILEPLQAFSVNENVDPAEALARKAQEKEQHSEDPAEWDDFILSALSGD